MISADQRNALAKLLETGAIAGAISFPDGVTVRVIAWGRDATAKSMEQAFDAVPAHARPRVRVVDPEGPKESPATDARSRTDRALALLDDHLGMTPHEAATRIGISPSAVYRALARRGRPCCPACRRPLAA